MKKINCNHFFRGQERVSNFQFNVSQSFTENEDKFIKMGLELVSIDKSPFSNSCYLKLHHKILDEVSIRISDHRQKSYNEFSYSHIYSIYSVNGCFNISLVYINEITKNVESKMSYENQYDWVHTFYASRNNNKFKQLNGFM